MNAWVLVIVLWSGQTETQTLASYLQCQQWHAEMVAHYAGRVRYAACEPAEDEGSRLADSRTPP